MIRSNCVFCNENLNNIIYTIPQFPISYSSLSDVQDYQYTDLNWVECTNCDIIQLHNLIDPNILYNSGRNNTYNLPTWVQHHTSFYNFVKMNIKSTSICEVGGSSCYLARLFLNDNIKYKIIDIAEQHDTSINIEYINANCEDYNFSLDSCILASHTFEHLYNPIKFIENISSKKVKEVFISVPNLKYQLDINSISLQLSIEHTFYFEEYDIIQLFSKYGYSLKIAENFKNHSHFLYFKYEESPNTTIIINKPLNRVNNLFTFFIQRELKIQNIKLTKDTFILPGGGYGSVIYYYLKETNKNLIKGFLDNDITKQNKYLYGTNILTYPLSHTSKLSNISIILSAGPYTDELITQLQSINNNLDIILIA